MVLSLANLAAHAMCLAALLRHLRQPQPPSGPRCLTGGSAAAALLDAPLRPKGTDKRLACAGRSGTLATARHDNPAGGTGPSIRYPYAWLWLGYGVAHANAWFMSAVFHTRDTRLTERLDYCSADVVMALSLLAMLVRALGLRRWVVGGQGGSWGRHVTERRCGGALPAGGGGAGAGPQKVGDGWARLVGSTRGRHVTEGLHRPCVLTLLCTCVCAPCV